MNGKAQRTADYLAYMLDAIRRIAGYVEDFDRVAFDRDVRTQDAVIRNLEILGEAARNILNHDPEFAAENSDIP